ncbi:MAG: molybdenum cofactor guanylyltransferase MobA [Rhodospirillales bacterium]|jgi:molybdopterin-guanine dinucleotide biosynthesis protein A|nr:molybdenum cofactor guanylyltransferase MobA [Rhodospirillales bacterium]
MAQIAENCVGVVLAGGLARRMGGGDKCLLELAGRPLMAHVIERAQPQVARLILNANGDPGRFRAFGLPVVADVVEGFAGPLAGVLTGLEWMRRNAPATAWMATFTGDAPFLARDLVARLAQAVDENSADIACAASGGRAHPVFGLWPVRLANDLRRALVDEGVRKIDAWTARHHIVHVDFSRRAGDPFFNVNRRQDLAEAERLLAKTGGAT